MGRFLMPEGEQVTIDGLVRAGVLAFSAVLFAFAVAPGYWFGVVALAACGLAFITCIPAINASIQLGVHERMRGRALALYFVALTGGFPLSACVGRADIMDAAWPPSNGEAIHTSTFLGHPVGCAMALAQIKEIARLKLVRRSATLGRVLLEKLSALRATRSTLSISCRGLGLLAGLEVRYPGGSPATKVALQIIKAMLRRGFILLPEGEHANVISFTPPLTITERQLENAVAALAEVLNRE